MSFSCKHRTSNDSSYGSINKPSWSQNSSGNTVVGGGIPNIIMEMPNFAAPRKGHINLSKNVNKPGTVGNHPLTKYSYSCDAKITESDGFNVPIIQHSSGGATMQDTTPRSCN